MHANGAIYLEVLYISCKSVYTVECIWRVWLSCRWCCKLHVCLRIQGSLLSTSCPSIKTCCQTCPVTRIHERTSQHSCTASYNTEAWWQRCGEKTHGPSKDPSSTCKANHTQRHWRDTKSSSTNRHLGMASPFQLREWKSTRDSRVSRLPLPLHADEHIIQETAASSPAGALAHWPCCHTSIKYRCVGPKDAQTVRLHPANGASTANVPNGHMQQLRVCAKRSSTPQGTPRQWQPNPKQVPAETTSKPIIIKHNIKTYTSAFE